MVCESESLFGGVIALLRGGHPTEFAEIGEALPAAWFDLSGSRTCEDGFVAGDL